MTKARQEIVSIGESGTYHVISRAVRRAWLCGLDSLTGRNYEHRREWIRERALELSGLFAIDLWAYAIMSNHYHLVVYVDAERARGWDDEEIARRWLRLCPPRGALDGDRLDEDSGVYHGALASLLADNERLALLRERLGDLSWLMRFLNQDIARRANLEDGVKGRFWEGRFKSQALLDEGAVLACMTYVDLNPVRAGMSDRPETSDYTSVQQRLQGVTDEPAQLTQSIQPIAPGSYPTTDVMPDIRLQDYLQLVEWSGRILREDKPGAIPAELAPLFSRLGLEPTHWHATIADFGRRFHRAAGHWEQLQAKAAALGQRWLKGLACAHACYCSA